MSKNVGKIIDDKIDEKLKKIIKQRNIQTDPLLINNNSHENANISFSNIEKIEENNVNEYSKAAAYLLSYISEIGFEIPTKKKEVEDVLSEFNERFSPDILESLPDDKLLNYLFYTAGDNQNSLCYWLERNTECRKHFGSISGGSAYKFGLFQKQNTSEWITGSPQKPCVLSDEDALEMGRNIRDALVKAAIIVKSASLNSIIDYEQLDSELWKVVGEPYCNWGWFHKYLSMVCPEKLSSFHSSEWQRHVLLSLKIRPSNQYFARSGQLAMIENYAGWYYAEFKDVLFERFGDNPIQFVKIETSEGINNYAKEWEKKSIVGIYWKDIGSLEDYVAGDSLDKRAIATALKEKYNLSEHDAFRKAGELIRFYKTDECSIIVAMDGERLISFIDKLGNYSYNPMSTISHSKFGTWHRHFKEGEYLPVKTEGKLASCYTITNEDNMMFLYEKYYYGEELSHSEEAVFTDSLEEYNKINFCAWLSTKMSSNLDVYMTQDNSNSLVELYADIIAKTPMPYNKEHSMFFTSDVDEVNKCIELIRTSEKNNPSQEHVLKQYLNYIIELQDKNKPLIYNTNLKSTYERNRIVFGAPGTGKSFKLKKDCEDCLKNTSGSYERVTFYPDYTYSQFVGTYKPVSNGTSIKYSFVPGPFMRVYVAAMKSARSNNPQPHILIIEEINRAKVASVFGDIFQLLDRDDTDVSEFEIYASEDIKRYLADEMKCDISKCKKLKIPNNMFIWATMNSADQGVFPMDTAFKRRWNFEYIGINKNEEKIAKIGKFTLDFSEEPIEWNRLRKAINAKLSSYDFKINEDKLMGPFFLSKKIIASNEDGMIIDNNAFISAFKSKVIMYLYEDAVKQKRSKFFEGCADNSKYSVVCDTFDKIGIRIFGSTFKEDFYDKED